MKKTLAVFFGGCSVEHEISLLSAKSILNNINQNLYSVFPVFIDRNGRWLRAEIDKWLGGGDLTYSENSFLLPSIGFDNSSLIYEVNGREIISSNKIDVVFPVLHGTYGEDGTIQGVFELMGVPYVGASVLGSSIGMDKIVMKSLLREFNIPVVNFLGFTKEEWKKDSSAIRNRIIDRIGFPCFAKSADLGSSVGINKVSNQEKLDQFINYSCKFSNRLIVEEAVDNVREIEVSVLGSSDPKSSVPGEIVPRGEFYDYDSKYNDDSTQLIVPADLDDSLVTKIRAFAIQTFKTLDCSGMGRVDFLINDNTNDVFVSELNTIPGFTSISMYPRLWEASGVSYPNLISSLIDIAFEVYEKKKELKRTYVDS